MILRNAPALGYTFEQARSLGFASASSREAWARTEQHNAMIEGQPARAIASRFAAERNLKENLHRAIERSKTGHGLPGMHRRGTITLHGKDPERVAIQHETWEEFRDAVVDVRPLNPQSHTTHYHPQRKD
ncbi:hypothetical protein CJ97_gp14 [Ralstonia phage RSB2]|uniref:Uncharacterized protein ORF14 n=1 Tax=Ralstonia phage RSB2 TaxID=913183 RepID=E5RUZ4_9CAUD|nr:hypothetical protein CJ97_gp14 [Ralstonia phage RSB2]BAJ51802.1 hypothetical protein [Ralstonia phage RSB2]